MVSNYFSLKDVTPLTLKANVVYCFKGSCDETQSYIGKKKKHLAVRVEEHISGKSGISAIHEHISSCKELSLLLYHKLLYYISSQHRF